MKNKYPIIVVILIVLVIAFYGGARYEGSHQGQPVPITQSVQPEIVSLTPTQGPSQTIVTIKGRGFDAAENLISFGTSSGRHHIDGSAENVIAHASSTDGTTLVFSVPAAGPSGIICSETGRCIAISAILLSPGTYPVSVSNKNGVSNSAVFTLTR